MASEIVASSAHAIVIVYALTSASPETVFSCEPSLSVVSDPTTAPSLVVATETVTVVHASEAPRYVQSTRHGTRETQVDSVPMLVMSMNDAVGAKDGSAVVGFGVGAAVVGFGVGVGVG